MKSSMLVVTATALALASVGGWAHAQTSDASPKKSEHNESGSHPSLKSDNSSSQSDRNHSADGDRSSNRPTAAEPDDHGKPKQADRGGHASDRSADQGDKDRNRSADRTKKDPDKSADRRDRDRDHDSVSLNVGSRLPEGRSVSSVSKTIIQKYPEYRSDKEVLVNDRILIIDPSTRKIVKSLSASEGRSDCR